MRRLCARTHPVVAATLLAVALTALPGCIASPRSPVETAVPYDGPPARLLAMTGHHIAVFTAPTGGWSVTWDENRPAYREHHVFVTLRAPDPTLLLSQARVDHRVDTRVETDTAITVFARIVPFNAEPEASPYRAAASTQGGG